MIRKVSPRKAREDREFREVCRERDEKYAHGVCEWPGCDAPWSDRHHVLRRSDFELALPFARILLCRLFCSAHHQLVTDNPGFAKQGGWCISLAEAVAQGLAKRSNKFNAEVA